MGISNRNLAIVGGVAAGFIASRLLAPMLANASGNVRARMGRDPFEKLINDHRLIMATLQEMERSGQASMAKKMSLFLTLKRKLGKHALAEEDVVYPLLRQELGDVDEARELYDDHAEIKIHLFEIEQLIRNNQDWSSRVRSLRELIEHHIHEEEDGEFPKLRRALNEQRTRMVAGQIHREEALVL